jgi:hypothetical protein
MNDVSKPPKVKKKIVYNMLAMPILLYNYEI